MKQLIANLNKPQITAPGWNPVPLNWSERVVDAPAGPLQPTRFRIAEMQALAARRLECWPPRQWWFGRTCWVVAAIYSGGKVRFTVPHLTQS